MYKNEKGITLIALIITIIVMLILVAVTISVALNGGLFNNAREAKEGTQKQVSKEELISAIVGAYDKTGNFVVGNVVLPKGTKWCTKTDESYKDVTQDQDTPTNWVITETGNKFYIDANGTVLDEEPEQEFDDLMPTVEELGYAKFSSGFKQYNFDIGEYTAWDVSFSSSAEEHTSKGIVGFVTSSSQQFFWFPTSEIASIIGTSMSTTFEPCKWYVFTSNGLQLYNGTAPIQASDFTPIGEPGSDQYKSNAAYIERIVNSFKK